MAVYLSSKHTNCLWEKAFCVALNTWLVTDSGREVSRHGGCSQRASPTRLHSWEDSKAHAPRRTAEGHHLDTTGRRTSRGSPSTHDSVAVFGWGTRVPESSIPAPLLKYSPTRSSSQLHSEAPPYGKPAVAWPWGSHCSRWCSNTVFYNSINPGNFYLVAS